MGQLKDNNRTLKKLIDDKNAEIAKLEEAQVAEEKRFRDERKRRSQKVRNMTEQLSIYSDFISSLLNEYSLPQNLIEHIDDV